MEKLDDATLDFESRNSSERIDLGQRVPKVSLEDKTIDKPRIERMLVPCPHCDALHDERTWTTQNGTAFGNWFGLYCKNCGNTIPCLMNGLSFLILAITFPIWGWFRKSLRAKWLEKQPKRYENIDIDHIIDPFDNKNWVKTGLNWGSFMFLMMSIGVPYLEGRKITWKTLLLGLVIWIIGGLLFGYTMRLFMNKTISKKDKIQLSTSEFGDKFKSKYIESPLTLLSFQTVTQNTCTFPMYFCVESYPNCPIVFKTLARII